MKSTWYTTGPVTHSPAAATLGAQAHPGLGTQPPATATGPVTHSPAAATLGAPATVTSAAQRQASYSALVAAKLAEGFLLIANSCPVTRVPLLQSQTGQLLSVGTGKWFELAADGQLVEIPEHLGAGPPSPDTSPHLQIDPAIQMAQPGAQGVGPTLPPVGHGSIDPELLVQAEDEHSQEGEEAAQAAEESEEQARDGMLFIVEHYFAFKRAVRHWRRRRALQASASPITTPTHSLLPPGTPTASCSQTSAPATTSEETRCVKAPTCEPSAATSSMEEAPGDAQSGLQGREGKCARARDGLGHRERPASVPASRRVGREGTHSMGAESVCDSVSLLGREYGTRVPPAAAEYERRDGVLSRDGGCVDMFSPQQGGDRSAPPRYASVGIQLPAAEFEETSAALRACDAGTSWQLAFGQYGQQGMRSHSAGGWWDNTLLNSLSWTRATQWHGFRGRRFASVHCPRRRRLLAGARMAPYYECWEIAVRRVILRSQHTGCTAAGYPYLATLMASPDLAPCWNGAVMVTRKFASRRAVDGGSLPCDSDALDATSGARRSAQCIPQTVGALAEILDRGLDGVGVCKAALTSWSYGWLGDAVRTVTAPAFTAAACVATAPCGPMVLPVTLSRDEADELSLRNYERLQHSPAQACFSTSHPLSLPLLRCTLRLRGAGDEDPQPVPAAMDTQLPRAGECGFQLMSLNMKGSALSERQVAGVDSWDCRMRALFSTLQLWRKPALLALQELGGGQASLDRLVAELHRLGYEAACRAGEETSSRKDAHRRGGVLLAWHKSQFRCARQANEGAQSFKSFALLHSADISDAQEGGHLTTAVSEGLQKYAGRRALAVRITRTRGPMANDELLFAVVYTPASASHAVRAAFIELIADKLAVLTVDAVSGGVHTPFVVAGDWNASPGPEYRRNKAPNDIHDDALHRRWFGLYDSDEHSTPIPSGLGKNQFTFRASTGTQHDRTIDFVFVDCSQISRWRASDKGGVFLGEWGGEGDAFDHRVGLFFCNEGTLDRLGDGRETTYRISKAPASWPKFRELAARFVAPPGATADTALASLEAYLAQCAREAMGADKWEGRAPRANPPDDPEVRLKWLQGLYAVVSAAYEWDSDLEARASAMFTDPSNEKLFKAVILRRIRDREFRRAAQQGKLLHWSQVRNACDKRLRDAIARLQPEVEARRRALRNAVNLGLDEPCSAHEFAGRLHHRLREIRHRKRAGRFQLAALTSEDGVIERSAEAVHAIAHRYGVVQNRLSASDDEAFGAWLSSLVPSSPPLTLPGGDAWTIRKALPMEVIRREVRNQRKGKARALHPFIVEMLHCLPDNHPAELVYYELLLRCMEEGVFPAHYLQNIAVLIPKKAAGLLHMALLRDIWLINHGAKLAERCLLHSALTSVGARVLPNHAGGCKGRGCTEQAFALHLCIDDALARRKPLYVLYVDLTKCFMSFSRTAADMAMRHIGVPEAALRALRGLVENWKHGMAQGRYETAFGATDPFPILRGFLQGAQGSPEACKIMMDTIAQALELKVSGYSAFAPDGAGLELGMLVFVDDAANVTGDANFLQRVTVFWSIWSRITDCQLNIKGKDKTVVQTLEYKRASNGTLTPTGTIKQFFIAGLQPNDPPRLIPNLLVSEHYLYCGMATRMDGNHNNVGLATLRKKILVCGAQAATSNTSRRIAIGCAGLGVYGNAFFYGTCFGGSFEAIEGQLGPVSRQVLQGAGVKGPRRSYSSPRVQLHAKPGGITAPANDDMAQFFVNVAGPAAFISGYGNAHVWPAMMAAAVMTLVNALASPVHTPAADRAHHAVARVLWTFGLRQLKFEPQGILIGPVCEFLRQDNVIERPMWLLCQLGAGYLPLVDCHFAEWSPLRQERWPGYPTDWIGLWHGPLYTQLRAKGVTFCPTLASGGIAELANLCDEVHGDFLGIDDILEAHPRAVELGAGDARRELAVLLGAITACRVAPVPGRRGWAMADAADGIIPPYVSAEYGLVRQVPLADLAQQKRSGDGGQQLAALLRVTVYDNNLPAAIQLLPDSAAISFTDAQHGLSFHRSIDRELMKYHLRKYVELAPAVLQNLPSGSSSAAVDKFWSACLYAKSVACILIGDSTDTPSTEAREVLDDMRKQGVDWLAWLHARPEETRDLAPDPEASDEGAHSQYSDNPSPENVRAALLLERRDALRADEEAVQRVDLELRELLERGGDPEVGRRFRQWLHEDDPPASPSQSQAEDEPGQRGSSPQRSPLGPVGSPGATNAPPEPPWMREPLLLCDYALSHLSPALRARESPRPPLQTDEACRVIRASDRFGILLIGLSPRAPPSDTEVHRAFVEAKQRIISAMEKSERGVTVKHPRWQVARCRIDGAWIHLRDRQNRLHEWSAWLDRRRGPVTTTIECVIHATALRALLLSPNAELPGRNPGTTVASEVRELLAASKEHPSDQRLRSLPISYVHSERGARLVAAGFVRYSREYAIGPDPFTCSRLVRDAALQEVSHDLDDAISFPTAQQAVFPFQIRDQGVLITMTQSATLIAQPKEVRSAVGNHLLRRDALSQDDIYARAKVLLSAIENGASCESWLRKQPPGHLRSSSVLTNIWISPTTAFNLAAFAREQEARARWLAGTRPHLISFVEALNGLMQEGDRDAELTAKSYVLQDYEGASRRAKMEWARRTQAQVVNLQHDGVRMRFPFDVTLDTVTQQISAACSAALGYKQVVCIKQSPKGTLLLDRLQPSILPPAIPQRPPTFFTPTVTSHDGARVRALQRAFSALLGGSSPPAPHPPGTAGPPQLELDGSTRRVIFSYDSKLQPDQREWRQRTQGGYHHEWSGRGEAWLRRARLAYTFDDTCRLHGNPFHPDCPLAARFWWECHEICASAHKELKVKECRFVFDKLLVLESEYPVSHFVATDGSKVVDPDSGNKVVSRACVAVAAEALGRTVLGGQLDVFADTFERHSYEAELAAFHDQLTATVGTVTVFVTDCLSGMQAGHAFPGRTVSSRAARYRDKELGDIARLEQRHRAILYVHVHSHDGITPNEAADAAAKSMLSAPIRPVDLMPSLHARCRIAGVKRGVGRAAFDLCAALMTRKLAGASSFTLLETTETWPLFCRAPVRAKLLTEATRDIIMDARADRCGLLADRLGDEVRERVLIGDTQRDRARAYRAQKGGWEWWCQTHAPCPCTGCFQARDVIVAGIWRPPPARAPQSRWHALTTCCIGETAAYRARAAGWLSQRLSDFGTRQAQYALAAISGNAERLGPLERHAALRFLLGLPDSPRAQAIVESKEAARTLALGYGRGFLKWIVGILSEGRRAACVARTGPRVRVNAACTTAVSYRGHVVVIERPAPRSLWTASRGLREVWNGSCLARRVFRALRLWTVMAGPEMLDRSPRSPGVPTAEPDRQGGHEAGCLAYDQWADHINLLTALAVKLPAIAGRLLAIAGKHQRKLVWLRNAGCDPTIERRKQALRDAREQAVRDARGRRQAAKAARAAAHLARREQSRAAREAAADQEEEARRASAAVTRPQRVSAVSTTAAIHAARLCNQSTPFEPPPAAVGAQERADPPRFRCTQGHFLVPAPVRSGRDSFQTRCNGPCGMRIRPGITRWMCEGRDCDLDICLECVGKDDSEGTLRARIRCPLGHSMCFRLTSALAHPDRKCDGE